MCHARKIGKIVSLGSDDCEPILATLAPRKSEI